jgi:hypothetical protein
MQAAIARNEFVVTALDLTKLWFLTNKIMVFG